MATWKARLARQLHRLELIHENELLAEEGFRLGLVWCRRDEVAAEQVPDGPGVLAVSSPGVDSPSLRPARSLRQQVQSLGEDADLVALIATPDYDSAEWLSSRLQAGVGDER